MNHVMHASAALAALSATLPAQDSCPRTMVQNVAQRVDFYGAVECGAVSLTIGGATFSGPSQGCPLLAVLTPAHQLEVPQTNAARTQVVVHSQVAAHVYTYRCVREWFLFLPWDSSCGLVDDKVGAALALMSTAPCAPIQAAGAVGGGSGSTSP